MNGFFSCDRSPMWPKALVILVLGMFVGATSPIYASDTRWEYRVVILQGVTAGGTIERDADGVYVDTKRTRLLNELAAQGWEVVAVTGSLAADHTLYLRREAAERKR